MLSHGMAADHLSTLSEVGKPTTKRLLYSIFHQDPMAGRNMLLNLPRHNLIGFPHTNKFQHAAQCNRFKSTKFSLRGQCQIHGGASKAGAHA